MPRNHTSDKNPVPVASQGAIPSRPPRPHSYKQMFRSRHLTPFSSPLSLFFSPTRAYAIMKSYILLKHFISSRGELKFHRRPRHAYITRQRPTRNLFSLQRGKGVPSTREPPAHFHILFPFCRCCCCWWCCYCSCLFILFRLLFPWLVAVVRALAF